MASRTGRLDRSAPARGRRQRPRRGPWKNGPLPVVGLVGGIGAGKSSIAAELANRGWHVLDADVVGHALLDQAPTRKAVIARFGEGVVNAENRARIDRAALGRIVFADAAARQDLERIIHPPMRRTFEKAIGRAIRRHQARGVVLDAAILFEAGWDDLCDLVAFVDAPQAVRVERVRRSRGWTPEKLASRERAQMPLSRKRARSAIVLENGGEHDQLGMEVDRLTRLVSERSRELHASWRASRRAAGVSPGPAPLTRTNRPRSRP